MALPARHPRAVVARIGGQQFSQHAAAQLQHPGPDHRLRRLQAGVAAQRPGGLRGQPPYLRGRLCLERVPEPLFSLPGREGPLSSPAAPGGDAGLASQIASLTSAICSVSAANPR